jgi:hypothetical protein
MFTTNIIYSAVCLQLVPNNQSHYSTFPCCLTNRSFGQDMTVFQSAAMRARSSKDASMSAASDEQQPHQLSVGDALRPHPSATYHGGRPMRLRRGPAADAVDQAAIDLQAWLEMPDSALSDPDDKGMCRIHRAAERGFVPIFEKAAANNKQLLELKTSDGLALTPLLVAVQVKTYMWKRFMCCLTASLISNIELTVY